jgi:hypothetical protein
MNADPCGPGSMLFQIYNTASVADPYHRDADPDPAFHFDTHPDPTFHSDVDPDSNFQFDADPDPITHFSPDYENPMLKMTLQGASAFSL